MPRCGPARPHGSGWRVAQREIVRSKPEAIHLYGCNVGSVKAGSSEDLATNGGHGNKNFVPPAKSDVPKRFQ